MSPTKSHRLEVGEDPVFQEFSWKAQRIGFMVMLLFVAAAVLGLFGAGGPLAESVVRANGLEVNYERFVRFDTGTTIEISLPTKAGDSISVEIGRSFADAVRIDRIVPPPHSISANPKSHVYAFAPASDSPSIVTIAYAPSRVGQLDGAIRVNGHTVSFRQFAYP
jgi:hypothetical protein